MGHRRGGAHASPAGDQPRAGDAGDSRQVVPVTTDLHERNRAARSIVQPCWPRRRAQPGCSPTHSAGLPCWALSPRRAPLLRL